MATETLQKIAVQFRLINGETSTGATKYVTLSLPNINKDGYSAAAVEAIVTPSIPVLAKSIGFVQAIKTSNITA